MADEVIFELRGHVAHITMNRPERHNAMSNALNQGLADAWEEVKSNDDIWLAVVKGAGRSFCSGMDLKERAEMDARGEDWSKFKLRGNQMPLDVSKPIIAAVHGYCLAGGWYLAQTCDFRIIADDATLAIREVKRGLMPGWVVDLPRLIGLAAATEIVLTGEYITPKRAYEMGFATRVVPRDQLDAEVDKLAAVLEENAPLSVRALKEVLHRGFTLPPSEARAMANGILAPVRFSEDIKEGPLAFAEKRAPQWKGR